MAKQKETPPVEEWITTREAAGLLGLHYTYIVDLIHNGTLQGRKVNNRLWLVNRASLENYQPKRKRHDSEQ
jgi:excisionase family DNA binding protein